jgi:IMP dehydrogenase
MAIILQEKSLWFNDVVCIPQFGKVRSRKEIPKELNRFIASPMTAVVGKTFAQEATKLGITVTIPRFLGIDKESAIFESCENKENLYLSMGLNDLDRIKTFGRLGCKNFLIDIASGYLPHIKETVKLLKDNTDIQNLMFGNVVTGAGYHYLNNIAVDYNLKAIIRCGISNGSGCETYSQTGFGRGALSELLEIKNCQTWVKSVDGLASKIASDGGLKDGGYVCKAFLAGADAVLIGGMFARSLESETHISGDGSYYGLASDKNQILSTGKKYRHSEGKEYQVEKEELKPLKDIVEELWGCVSSAVSYSGHKTLTEAIGNGVFEIKNTSLPPRKR